MTEGINHPTLSQLQFFVDGTKSHLLFNSFSVLLSISLDFHSSLSLFLGILWFFIVIFRANAHG